MRLFAAVTPDEAALSALAALARQGAERAGAAAAALRWTRPENQHLTIHFLGELDEARAARASDAVALPAGEVAFDLACGPPAIEPPAGPARLLWLPAGAGRDGLARLHAALGVRLAAAGMALERRPFRPHLTLARVRPEGRRQWRALRDRLAGWAPAPVAWRVDRVTLFRSDLTGPSPRYTPLREVWLDPGPRP